MNKIPHAVLLFGSAFMGTLIFDYFAHGGTVNWVRNIFVSSMMTLILVYVGNRKNKNT
jgi:hypothetical protein